MLQALPLIPPASSCQPMINCWKLLKAIFSHTIITKLFVKEVFAVSSEASDALFEELYWNNGFLEQGTCDDLVSDKLLLPPHLMSSEPANLQLVISALFFFRV